MTDDRPSIAELQRLRTGWPDEIGEPQSVANAQGIAWMRTNLSRLLDGYTEALEEVERLRKVASAAAAWRSAQCDKPNDCGDGYTYHGHDCPTNEHMRALVDAVDALEPKP